MLKLIIFDASATCIASIQSELQYADDLLSTLAKIASSDPSAQQWVVSAEQIQADLASLYQLPGGSSLLRKRDAQGEAIHEVAVDLSEELDNLEALLVGNGCTPGAAALVVQAHSTVDQIVAAT